MIFDKMERLAQYKGICKNLDALIDYTLAHPYDTLQDGKNVIDGTNCWISKNVAAMKQETRKYERHCAYIDLQIPITEGEIISVRPVEDIEWPAFDTETAFTQADRGVDLDLVPGTFAIFFPGDAHCCSISKNGVESVRKLVGKARFED